MILLWPWMLVSLAGVAAAAAWALFRPGRQLAVVGSLELWKQALARLDRSILSRSRRISAAWWCLLAGAVLAGLAMGRPVWRTQPPGREIAVAVVPAAEAGDGASLRKELREFLARLSPNDRIQLVLPIYAPPPKGWLSPSQIGAELDALRVWPVRVDRIPLRPAGETVQHTYYFAPAGLPAHAGANISYTAVAPQLPTATLDALAAKAMPGGKVQLFVAVRNHTDQPQELDVVVTAQRTPLREGTPSTAAGSVRLSLKPRDRGQVVMDLPDAPGLTICMAKSGQPLEGAGAQGFLARREAQRVKVAMIGPDEPLLRWFVEVDKSLEAVDAKDADLIVANRVNPPAGKSAIVVAPPDPPPGWGKGPELSDVDMGKVQAAADHAVMQDVEMTGLIRRARPWVAGENAEGTVLARIEQGALIVLAGGPSTGGATAPAAKRVYVAFDVGANNTTWGLTPSFVVFLANAVEALAVAARERTYGYSQPLEDGTADGPGLYLLGLPSSRPHASANDNDAEAWHPIRAVSLVGLRNMSATNSTAVADLPLPPPRPIGVRHELWPILAAVAVGLWLLGWFLRARE